MSAEILHTCPSCGRGNFTTRGLRTHRCERVPDRATPQVSGLRPHPSSSPMPKPSSKLVKKAPPTAVEVMPEISDKQLGQELTRLFHDAEDGFRRVLRFGAAYLKVEQLILATRGQNAPKAGKGAYGFATWLEDHAPEISRTSARRYRDITEALCGKFKIKNPELVFGEDVAALPPADQAKRQKALAFVEDKSMRQIQLELDLTTKPAPAAGTRAGAKIAATAALPPEEQQAELLAGLRKQALETFTGLNEIQDLWQLLSDEHLAITLRDLAALQPQIKAWLALAPAQRAAFAVDRHISGAAEEERRQRRAEGLAFAAFDRTAP